MSNLYLKFKLMLTLCLFVLVRFYPTGCLYCIYFDQLNVILCILMYL